MCLQAGPHASIEWLASDDSGRYTLTALSPGVRVSGELVPLSTSVPLASHTIIAFGAEAEIAWGENPYPVTFNDPDATDHLRGVLRQKLGAEQVREERNPSMGGEDFSYYGYRIPACFFFLGLKNSPDHVIPNLHSPFFDFNDAAIPVGIGAMTALAQS